MTGCFKTSCFLFVEKMHKPRNENWCNFTYWQIHMTYGIMAARSQSKRAELSIISHLWKFVKPFYDKKMHKNFPKISSLCTTDHRGFAPNNYTISYPGLSRLIFKKNCTKFEIPESPFLCRMTNCNFVKSAQNPPRIFSYFAILCFTFWCGIIILVRKRKTKVSNLKKIKKVLDILLPKVYNKYRK